MSCRAVFLLLLVLTMMVSSSSLTYSLDRRVTVIVTFHEAFLESEAYDSSFLFKEEAESMREERLIDDVNSKVGLLRRAGIPFTLIDTLIYVVHGAVLEVPDNYVEVLRGLSFIQGVYVNKPVHQNLVKSSRWVRATEARNLRSQLGEELTGKGIRIAIIDTGIDYTHPDLGGGLGHGKKVVGGYDFVDGDEDPMDIDGHGTMVAGIIAADGRLQGIAPEAKLLAYRVASRMRNMFSTDIIRALERAVKEGAKVVNISLGVESAAEEVRKAVRNAAEEGLIIVAASGNSGPKSDSIRSPASDRSVIAVGASLNNVSLSLAAMLEVDYGSLEPTVFPMRGSAASMEASGRIVFVKYARADDVKDMDLRGAIALAERGGELGERVYFSEKERNVGAKGALGLIVYNNQPGFFHGALVGPHNPPLYEPSIPVVSMSREDGLTLRRLLQSGSLHASLKVFVAPDTITPFSSRGPSSPFYVKPDLVAPGAFINSTLKEGRYGVMSGTSFATPHVAGATALLLQKKPDLTPNQIRSILASTAVPILKPKGGMVSAYSQGSGRLDVFAAVNSQIIIDPYQMVLHLSEKQRMVTRRINIESIGNESLNIESKLMWPHSSIVELKVEPKQISLTGEGASINITAALWTYTPELYEGRLNLVYDGGNLTLPILIRINEVPIDVRQDSNTLSVSIFPASSWSSATVSLVNPEGVVTKSTLNPSSSTANFTISSNGEYWIKTVVQATNKVMVGHAIKEVVNVSAAKESLKPLVVGVPLKVVMIAGGFIGSATLIVLAWMYVIRRRGSPLTRPSATF